MLVEVTRPDIPDHLTTPRRRQRRLLCGLCRHVSDALEEALKAIVGEVGDMDSRKSHAAGGDGDDDDDDE